MASLHEWMLSHVAHASHMDQKVSSPWDVKKLLDMANVTVSKILWKQPKLIQTCHCLSSLSHVSSTTSVAANYEDDKQNWLILIRSIKPFGVAGQKTLLDWWKWKSSSGLLNLDSTVNWGLAEKCMHIGLSRSFMNVCFEFILFTLLI